MRHLIFVLFLQSLINNPLFAQQPELSDSKVDSLEQNSTFNLQQADSLLHRTRMRADSIKNKFSLPGDSVRTSITNRLDSLERTTLGRLDSSVNQLNNTLDSLGKLTTLPGDVYKKKVDSLYKNFQEKVLHRYTHGGDSVTQRVKEKAHALEGKLKNRTRVLDSLVTANGGNFDLSLAGQFDAKLPEVNLPAFSTPDTKLSGTDLGQVKDVDGQIPGLPEIKMPSLDLSMPDEVKTITEKAGEASALVTEAGDYAKDIENIKENGLKESTKLPELAEKQLMQIDEAKGMQSELAKTEAMKKQLEGITTPLQDEEALRKEAYTKAKQQAVDHFAGHEEALQKGMDEVAKYKEKYETVGSVTDLAKRPPNPLKALPFVERLIPGFYLQYQRKGEYWIDVNPYVGYKLQPWFAFGAGWNERLAYTAKHYSRNRKARIYGPRVYGDVYLGKGFIIHLETELMNSFVPRSIFNATDEGEREWVWGMMTGLKKEFGIYKNLRGIVLIQYNLFDPKHKSPYSDRLNSRLGFQWTIKKKVKPH